MDTVELVIVYGIIAAAILATGALFAASAWALWNTFVVVFAHAPRMPFAHAWAVCSLATLVMVRLAKWQEDGE